MYFDSGQEGTDTTLEEKVDEEELHTLLETETPVIIAEEVEEERDLDELLKDYKPSWLMKGIVDILKKTHLGEVDYSEMGVYETFVTKYVKRPTTSVLGFLARAVAVGGTSGDIMRNASMYLEKELGIKETPLEYTRNSLIFCGTYGLTMTAALMTGAIVMPALPFVPAVVAGYFAAVNPFIYVGDLFRRTYLYSQGKPSGPIYFEMGWWAKNQIQDHIIKPTKELYQTKIQPALSEFYDNKIAPAWDKAREWYIDNIQPKFDKVKGYFDREPLSVEDEYSPVPLAVPFTEEPLLEEEPEEETQTITIRLG